MQPFRAKRKIRATLHIFVGKLEAVSEHLQSLLFSVRESRCPSQPRRKTEARVSRCKSHRIVRAWVAAPGSEVDPNLVRALSANSFLLGPLRER